MPTMPVETTACALPLAFDASRALRSAKQTILPLLANKTSDTTGLSMVGETEIRTSTPTIPPDPQNDPVLEQRGVQFLQTEMQSARNSSYKVRGSAPASWQGSPPINALLKGKKPSVLVQRLTPPG